MIEFMEIECGKTTKFKLKMPYVRNVNKND